MNMCADFDFVLDEEVVVGAFSDEEGGFSVSRDPEAVFSAPEVGKRCARRSRR